MGHAHLPVLPSSSKALEPPSLSLPLTLNLGGGFFESNLENEGSISGSDSTFYRQSEGKIAEEAYRGVQIPADPTSCPLAPSAPCPFLDLIVTAIYVTLPAHQ